MTNLTSKQKAALKSVSRMYQAARHLDAHPRTLTSLVRMSLVDREYDTANRRWKYRITGIGTIVLNKIRQDEEEAPAPSTENRIRAAYATLASETGAWVGLARLRAELADIARADVDAALMQMVITPGVLIDPEFNQKTLTPTERAAALHMGGEDCHMIAIGRQ